VASRNAPRSPGHMADQGAADRGTGDLTAACLGGTDQEAPDLRAADVSPGDLGPGDLGRAEALSKLLRRLAVTGLRLLSLCQNLDRPGDRVVLIQAAEDLDAVITEIRRLAIASLLRSD
jgi:hypothetical protein